MSNVDFDKMSMEEKCEFVGFVCKLFGIECPVIDAYITCPELNKSHWLHLGGEEWES